MALWSAGKKNASAYTNCIFALIYNIKEKVRDNGVQLHIYIYYMRIVYKNISICNLYK